MGKVLHFTSACLWAAIAFAGVLSPMAQAEPPSKDCAPSNSATPSPWSPSEYERQLALMHAIVQSQYAMPAPAPSAAGPKLPKAPEVRPLSPDPAVPPAPGQTAGASALQARQIPGLTGDLTEVRYGPRDENQPQKLVLVGGKLGDYYFVGSMEVLDRLKGSGYIWADPRNLKISGHEDVRIFRISPAGEMWLQAQAGVKFHASSTDGSAVNTGGVVPRAGFTLERVKVRQSDSLPAVTVQVDAGPEVGALRGMKTAGAGTDIGISIKF